MLLPLGEDVVDELSPAGVLYFELLVVVVATLVDLLDDRADILTSMHKFDVQLALELYAANNPHHLKSAKRAYLVRFWIDVPAHDLVEEESMRLVDNLDRVVVSGLPLHSSSWKWLLSSLSHIFNNN